jgi:hypothetical protein
MLPDNDHSRCVRFAVLNEQAVVLPADNWVGGGQAEHHLLIDLRRFCSFRHDILLVTNG